MMKQHLIQLGLSSFLNRLIVHFAFAFFASCFFTFHSNAQQKIYGNISIPSGAQLTIFGTQDFANGATSGVLRTERTAPYGVLNVSQNAQFLNTGDKGYVDGYVRKFGSALFTFPVGHDGFYGPFLAVADKITGAYFHKNPSSASYFISSKELSIGSVSGVEYWDIDGANSTPITLTWSNSSVLAGYVSQLARLTIVGWKGGKWVKIPSEVNPNSILNDASSISSGSIKTLGSIVPNDFEAFTLATVSESLPVTLVSFTAKPEGNTALLSWTTSFETNSDHFEIERSKDGKTWQQIGATKSVRESNVNQTYGFIDLHPLPGENLYRLKMVDADETFAYSNIRSILFGDKTIEYVIFPNPASHFLKFKSGISKISKAGVKITDINGREHTSAISWVGEEMNIEALREGIYMVSFSDKSGNHIQSKFVVQR